MMEKMEKNLRELLLLTSISIWLLLGGGCVKVFRDTLRYFGPFLWCERVFC